MDGQLQRAIEEFFKSLTVLVQVITDKKRQDLK